MYFLTLSSLLHPSIYFLYLILLIINSTFSGNKATNQSAILSFRIPISLSGTTTFRENQGGAITLLQSRVDISGSATFKDNSARVGAALILEDQRLVLAKLLHGPDYFLLPAWRRRRSILSHEDINNELYCITIISDNPFSPLDSLA